MGLDASQQQRSAHCLRLIASCLQDSASDTLAAASNFILEAAVLLPDLDSRCMVNPLVSAVLHIPADRTEGQDKANGGRDNVHGNVMAEVAEHVTSATAPGLADLLQALRAAAGEHGIACEDWPNGSKIRLLSFCKEVSTGPKTGIPDRYAAAEHLLHEMHSTEVV